MAVDWNANDTLLSFNVSFAYTSWTSEALDPGTTVGYYSSVYGSSIYGQLGYNNTSSLYSTYINLNNPYTISNVINNTVGNIVSNAAYNIGYNIGNAFANTFKLF